jgi:hypothetical protein
LRQKDQAWFCIALCWRQLLRKADPKVAYMEKTGKWLKLRVHSVALRRYISEGGLEVAREEIELMTGEHLPFAPRWIINDTLANMTRRGVANMFVCLFVCLFDSIRLFTVTI